MDLNEYRMYLFTLQSSNNFKTSSNQRLSECVRRRNFYTDTLNDPLADFQPLSVKTNIFSSTTGVFQKDISVTVHAILIEEVPYKLDCVTAPVYLK